MNDINTPGIDNNGAKPKTSSLTFRFALAVVALGALFELSLWLFSGSGSPVVEAPEPQDPVDAMTLVLSAPSVDDQYYAPAFDAIVDFHIGYAQQTSGRDEVRIVVDEQTRPYYEGRVADELLITANVEDIWMRDFTLVNPNNPVQFTYTDASVSAAQAEQTQQSFSVFAEATGIASRTSDLVLDGGNIVDNYQGDIITTTRFLEDNNLSIAEGKQALAAAYGAERVAIIEPDEDVLAHSDGMVAWLDGNTLLVNDYSQIDPELQDLVRTELLASFPDVEIIEVPVAYRENAPGEWVGFSSACGVNLNFVLTNSYVYVPTFGMSHDEQVLDIIRANTDKEVVPINAEGVCGMGGSVRCLTLQLGAGLATRL